MTVVRVALVARATTLNSEARWITQSYLENKRPVTAHQLKGEKLVVGEADSGLDYFSCFFYDSETDVTFQNSLFRDVSHRKMIEYVGFADEVAGEVGDHGTHVAGSIIGGVASADDGGGIDDDGLVTAAHRFDGMAFEGKMAFFDIGEAGQPFLNVPGALEDSMFPFAYVVSYL